MMGFTLKWAKRISVLGLFTLVAVFGWSYLWPKQEISSLRPASAIVCLGGGVSPKGELHAGSANRARTCAALYNAGLAPLVAFTGGNSAGGPSAAKGMADLAMSLGVPKSAVLQEDDSQSTLQNALYTLPMLQQTEDLILVTDAFHLPRSWVSFRWAGATDLSLFASKQGETSVENADIAPVKLLRESAAIWFNLGRATLWSAASLVAAPSDDWLY